MDQASRPFRSGVRLRHHPKTPTVCDCLAARPPSSRKVLLGPHSHSRGFESRGMRAPRTGHHSGAPRASQVSGSCRRLRHVASGCYPAGHSALPRPSRAAAVCSKNSSSRFQGTEHRSFPLPTAECFSLFGTVSQSAYRQALAGLSQLSSSRPADLPPVPEARNASARVLTDLVAPCAG